MKATMMNTHRNMKEGSRCRVCRWTKWAAVAGLGLLGSSTASAALIVDLGDIELSRNTAGQIVFVDVWNNDPSAVSVAGLNFNFQVADSGPDDLSDGSGWGVIDGPNITGVDIITGTPFEGNSSPVTAGLEGHQAVMYSVTTDHDTVTIPGNGTVRLATLTFDTTGFTLWGTWSIMLAVDDPGVFHIDTDFVNSIGDSLLVDAPSGTLSVVPEPVTSSVFAGCALLGLVGYRRWQRRRS